MKFLLCLMLFASVSSYSNFDPSLYEEAKVEYSTDNPSRDLWKRYGLKDYSFIIQQTGCWCFHKLTRVYVIGGKIKFLEVLEKKGGGKVPELDTFRTIDGYLLEIQEYYSKKPASFSVRYDRSLGYPVEFNVDPLGNSFDDEDGFKIHEVVPLKRKTHNK